MNRPSSAGSPSWPTPAEKGQQKVIAKGVKPAVLSACKRAGSLSEAIGQKLSPDQKILASVLGVWCAVIALNTQFTILGSQEATNVFCLLLLVAPLLIVGPNRGFKNGLRLFTFGNRNPKALLIWVFIGCAAWSAAFSGAALASVGYLAATVIGFLAFGELHSRLGASGFVYLMRVYSSVGAIAVLGTLILHGFTGTITGRLTLGPGDHPNHFGLVCWSILCAALAWESIIVKSGLVSLMLAFMSQAESRTVLIASAVSLAIYPLVRYRKLWQRALLPSMAVIALIVVNTIWPGRIMDTVSSILMLNDKYRGAGSGLAGRAEQLPVALDLIAASPLLGHGYHVQNTYLPQGLLEIGAFHNGYIGLIVEIGFLGAVPLFYLIGIGVVSLWRKAWLSSSCAVEFALVAGYLVYVTAQPYLINQTNPASALFWTALCGALLRKMPQKQQRRVVGINVPSSFRPPRLYPSERRAQMRQIASAARASE